MKHVLAGSLLGIAVLGAPLLPAPAAAQSIEIGPGGPSIDLRSRRQREVDEDREEARREERREIRREERRRAIEDEEEDDRPRRRY